MRAPLALLVALATTQGSQQASADERPIVRIGLDSRVAVSSVSFAEQTGDDSRGNDLGRFSGGLLLAAGLQTSDVAVLVQGGLNRGGLSGDVANHYFSQTQGISTFAFTIGGLARFERPSSSNFAWLAELHVGYGRMMLQGDGENAHLTSLFMEVGGGISKPIPIAGLDSHLAVTVGMRAHRLRSLGATGLTDGGVGVDDPQLVLLPGVSVSTDIRF